MRRLTTYAFAMTLLILAQHAHAQFIAIMISAPPASALTTTCGGAITLPEGTVVKVFMDVDSDGPDFDDPQPTVCTNPPECNSPADAVNFNQFTVNGEFLGIGPGYFGTDPGLSCLGMIPSTGRFYLRIYEPDNTTVLWTSTVFTVQVGLQEVNFTDADWTCGAVGPQCTVIDESE